MTSIRRRLLVVLLGVLTLLMLLAAGLSYRAGLQEAGEMFDARLVQSARVLLSLVDEPLSDLSTYPGDPIVLHGWHGRADGVGEALAFKDGHAYENKLAFQIWAPDGHLLLRSDSAPTVPMATLSPGYADVQIDGAQWRTFTLRSPQGRWFQSAERSDIRQELAEDIAMGTLLPLLFALPVMALVIWLTVAWATRSLRRVSNEIGERDPERMTPLDDTKLPEEVHGLVRAVNELLQRLDLALARERRFIADAAHELRTPISAVKVHADNAYMAATDAERQESQGLLAQGVERVERLVSQLLSLSRTERGIGPDAFRKLSLDAIVGTEAEELRRLASSRRQALNLLLDKADVFGDEFSLGLLVRNLVENAIRYTPEDGVVVVSTQQSGDQAILTVADSGPGIPVALQGRVFDRFYRVLGSGAEGSGLGLSIVRETLEAHGGQITLGTSECLHGLKATVTLPANGRHPPSPHPPAEA